MEVKDANGLTQALTSVKPGQKIVLADGRYQGAFDARTAASAEAPILLCGGSGATLAGDTSGYTLHLDGANWWTVGGFVITGGEKGLMVDRTNHATLSALTVSGTGHEAVHLRSGSSDNVVSGLKVDSTGLTRPEFGEGIYVGSAKDNWCRYSACQPDTSDRNTVTDNTFGPAVTAENIDIKEGTTGGTVAGNSFNGAGTTAADSWVDVKGNNWQLTDNRGQDAPKDGMQVHVQLPGWGNGNTFANNNLTVDAAGYGFRIAKDATGTVVVCNNKASGAAAGLANIPCT